jgi:hypothetical protein
MVLAKRSSNGELACRLPLQVSTIARLLVVVPWKARLGNSRLDFEHGSPKPWNLFPACLSLAAWGSNSSSRVARQQIPHQIYKDGSGTEHVRVRG